MSYLPAIEVETASPATASVIWLHGLGASGHDFEPIVPELNLPEGAAVRFIFPHAPSIPVTVNGGYVMPAWYDIVAMDIDRKLDLDQLLDSAGKVSALIDRERQRGVASDRIVLAGFSQGGAVALQAALTYPEPLAGLIAMSTYFATAGSIVLSEANRNLPIQVFHGTEDPMVPEGLGRKTCENLKEMGYQPGYHTYPMAHAVCLEEIEEIARYLKGWLLA